MGGLRPNTTYSLRVAAITVSGIGAPSEPLVVTTRPELRVPGPPTHVKAIPFTSQIIVSWSVPAVTNGKVQQYKLYYYEVNDFRLYISELPQFRFMDYQLPPDCNSEHS